MKRLTLFFLLAAASMGWAESQVEDLADLKKIQSRVLEVVRNNTNATISLISEKVGSSGSGVIISAEGLILTAAHVVEGSEEMTVLFPDGRQARARVLGGNYNRDAAMAQILGEGPWPFAELGDSDQLEVGHFVVAMGHPRGFDPTRRPPVRFGRVMTKGKLDFVTTDCTLIGGDSGGPLFDLDGKVVGIHSHIGSNRQVNNHAGVSGYKASWDKMKAGKNWGVLGGDRRDPDRPVLGLTLREDEGKLLVEDISRNSPADRADFQPGDWVISMAGQKLTEIAQLAEVFVDLTPGEVVEVVYLRKGRKMTAQVPLARLGEVYRNQRR